MDKKRHAILFNDEQLGPYPLEKLKRVDKPTTKYVGEIHQRCECDTASQKGARGEYGKKVQQGYAEFMTKEPLFATLADLQSYLNQIPEAEPAPDKAPIPDDPRVVTRHIKKLAYFFNADMVGVCTLPRSAVYSHDKAGEPKEEINLKYAIVMLVGKKFDTIDASFGDEWIDDPVSLQCYQRLALITENTANYIRRLGWPAKASVVDKYKTVMPQLIIESGLGEGCRLGIALNPFLGPAIKSACVLTDLPLVPDKPIDFGLQEYCSNCTLCADNCVARAITKGGKTVHNGYETWLLNSKACAINTALNDHGKVCGRCVKVCPWTRPDSKPEDFKDWDGSIAALHKSVNQRAQFLKDHDFVHPDENSKKWWLPLMNNNGKLVEGPEYDYRKMKKVNAR